MKPRFIVLLLALMSPFVFQGDAKAESYAELVGPVTVGEVAAGPKDEVVVPFVVTLVGP